MGAVISVHDPGYQAPLGNSVTASTLDGGHPYPFSAISRNSVTLAEKPRILAMVIIPVTARAARSLVRTADPTDCGLAAGSAVGIERLAGTMTKVHALMSQYKSMMLDELISLPGDDFVRAAYLTILGRALDEEGQGHYRRRLRQGFSKAAVLDDLIRSKEAKRSNRCDDLAEMPDDGFLEVIYRRVLGRELDSDGKQHYLDALGRHGDRRRVFREIQKSGEANQRNRQLSKLKKDLKQRLREESGRRGWWGNARRGATMQVQINQLIDRLDETATQLDALSRRLDHLEALKEISSRKNTQRHS
jgi:hypothetical protein